jgi:hypothetical protein
VLTPVVRKPAARSGARIRGRLTPAVSIETISFERDIRPRLKSSARSSPSGSEVTRICGTCVR